jgi:hypothetical protein
MDQFLERGRNVLFSTESKLPLESTIHSAIQRVSGAASLAVKQLGHEADHPLPVLRLKIYRALFPNPSSRQGA